MTDLVEQSRERMASMDGGGWVGEETGRVEKGACSVLLCFALIRSEEGTERHTDERRTRRMTGGGGQAG